MAGNTKLSVPLAWAVFVVTVAAIFAMALQVPLDTDTYWHLAAGQWQVENGAILMEDIFSSTRLGAPWVNHSWLSQSILFLFYRTAGDLGLALFTALLATGGMIFIYLQCDADPIIAGLAVILAGAAAAVFWSARPQMVSFFLSTVVLYLLWLYEVRSIDRLWLIPLIMLVWVNLHAGFALGFVLLVLYSIGTALHWLLDGLVTTNADFSHRQVLRPIIIGLVSAALVSLNPYGLRMLLYPFETVGIDALRTFIQEWAVPDFRSPQIWPFVWLLLATFLAAGLSSKRLWWTSTVLLAGTAYLSLAAARNIAAFAIVAAPVLAYHLHALSEDYHIRLRTRKLPSRGLFAYVNITLIVLAVLGAIGKTVYEMQPERINDLRSIYVPSAGVAYLNEADIQIPLLNSYNWGGYLIWAGDEIPVFVDGRTDLYGDEILGPYLSMYLAAENWQSQLDEYDIQTVFVERISPIGLALADEPGWQMVHEDNLAVVFVREDR